MVKEYAKGGYPETNGIWVHGDKEPCLVGKIDGKGLPCCGVVDSIVDEVRKALENSTKLIVDMDVI